MSVLLNPPPPKTEAPLRKFRIVKREGQPVGPHVDFARDEQGNLIRGPEYVDEMGRRMPGDYLERMYYPGDEVWSSHDLTELNGKEAGLCQRKFEPVDTSNEVHAPAVMTVEEARKFLESQGAKVEMPKSEIKAPAETSPKPQRVSKESLEAKGFKDLLDLAKAEGVDLKGKSKKEEVIPILLAALNGV